MLISYPNLSERSLIYKYFDLINAAQPNQDRILTEKEIELLTEFLLLPKKFKYQLFSLQAKQKVIRNAKEFLNWELTKENLNNKIYALIGKGYLKRDSDSVIYLQRYISQTVEELLEAKKNKGHKDIIFRFDYKEHRTSN